VVDKKKKIYAEAFAILGLSKYSLVFHEQEAADFALDCFFSLDGRFHDPVNGGYDQRDDPDSWIGGAARGTNTHIHLMEALTLLYSATNDETVGERLDEFINVVVDRLLQPQGYVHWSFDSDWLPLGDPSVSYGHDLEITWLLLEAARLAGRESEIKIVEAAVTMGANSSACGFDVENGGFFDSGIPDGEVTNDEKVWWAQFESILGLWRLFELTGDTVHLERLEKTLEWIEECRDKDYGEWFWGHYPDGSLGPRGDRKGEEWKTSYHNLRSLVLCLDWMEEAVAGL